MLELHNVTIEPLIHSLSLTVDDGQLVCLTGSKGSGKTTLLRAVLGLIPIQSGHISIDGELLTPLSAPYFRRQIAYVPQRLTAIDDYDSLADLSELLFGLRVNKGEMSYKVPTDGRRWAELSVDERYLLLLSNAMQLDKRLMVIDEPAGLISAETMGMVDAMLQEKAGKGVTILAVNSRILQNQIQL
ncbi:MAG: ATP-binding cassette domain-containing protein [Prevotella sp.]|nr:ATP-binding cassette domain-containing protein [Prevotella sp.]